MVVLEYCWFVMSMGRPRSLKILVKILCVVVIVVSSYFLYHALSLPLTYPILNIVTVALLILLVAFSIAAILT